jgi:molecular chaperone GrpE
VIGNYEEENHEQEPAETSETFESEILGLKEEEMGAECAELVAQKDPEIKQLQDRALRLAAEAENTRKRLDREKSEGICYANEGLIRELLPVIDNLERAVRHGEDDADLNSVLDGVRMTLKSFGDVLARHGCSSFESVGEAFDPNFHEALMQQPSGEHPDRTILQEFQKGYKLRDRLLRPASVVVSKALDKDEAKDEPSE